MELKEFIKNTLVEIAVGIHDANQELKTPDNKTDYFELQAHGSKNENYIVFDVAVGSSEKGTVDGKGGVKVFDIGVGIQSEMESQKSNTSRIKFFVKLTHNIK